MAYSTQADIEDAVGGLAELKRILRTSTVSSAVLDEQIAAADAMIDAFARGTEGHPWSPVPEAVKQASIDLAVAKIYERIWSATQIPQGVRDAYARALDWLRDLAAGRVSVVEGQTPAAQQVGRVSVYLPGDEPREGNRRRTRRDTLDCL